MADCMARCLILYTSGNWTWIGLSGDFYEHIEVFKLVFINTMVEKGLTDRGSYWVFLCMYYYYLPYNIVCCICINKIELQHMMSIS